MVMTSNIIRVKQAIKCFCVSRMANDARWINEGHIEIVNNILDADIVIFPGGMDINPEIYKEEASSLTKYNKQTDDYEVSLFQRCVQNEKFIVGICRGAQLSCALSGGKLIQHVMHHCGSNHVIIDKKTKKTITVNSFHHQMMFPYYLPPEKYDILAYSKQEHFDKTEGFSFTYLFGKDQQFKPASSAKYLKDDPLFMEPEIVYFKQTKAFAIQCHPEMMTNKKEELLYFNSLLLPLFMEHKLTKTSTYNILNESF